jgi:hypothetical protein
MAILLAGRKVDIIVALGSNFRRRSLDELNSSETSNEQ